MTDVYRGEYEQALYHAQQIRMPALFLDPVARAVALGYLGHLAEAKTVASELFELIPDFQGNGRELIQRFWRYEKPVGLIVEGLRKAGLEL
jgi:hypothetical protein